MGLVSFWPMPQLLGQSLNGMGSSAPHPAAETGKTREEHIELSRTDQGLSFTGSFLPSVHQPHLHKGDHTAVDSPALGTSWPGSPFLCHCQPTSSLPQLLAPG